VPSVTVGEGHAQHDEPPVPEVFRAQKLGKAKWKKDNLLTKRNLSAFDVTNLDMANWSA
jgi:hypothetical protein